ncbi:hypothetical protein [Streptacidiphilus fuscans]|uniref:Uncharacterized protein n=1 Tax=Streptacidiphilus fuscans TaxID=2789292 RepID=A0A931B519_9ACTN|nr:hypothetical protein [Streptacidiphilus fuscans]MBF9070479.1 hypothetical protein [Streptacidiphilus fuscans]
MNTNGKPLNAAGVAALVLAAAPLLGGCGSVGHDVTSEQVTLTAPQAHTEIDKIYAETFTSITPSLKWRDGWPQVNPNVSGLTGQADGTATVSEDRYNLTIVAADKRPTLLAALAKSWQHLGFSVTSDVSAPIPRVDATEGGGTRASVQVMPSGVVDFTVVVGNIKDPGIGKENALFGPEPPQPTDANGAPDVTPKYEDPYWSR